MQLAEPTPILVFQRLAAICLLLVAVRMMYFWLSLIQAACANGGLILVIPEMIVALGAHAAKTLLNSTAAIGELRGRVHAYYPEPLSKPIKLVATYHPAYLLRNYSPDNRRRVWHDMQMVLKELGLPVPRGKQE